MLTRGLTIYLLRLRGNSYDVMKASTVPCRILSLAGLFVLSISACGPGEKGTFWKKQPLNRGSLTIRYNAPLGFGAHTLRFYFREGKHVQLLAEMELHNDGANLGDQNLQLPPPESAP